MRYFRYFTRWHLYLVVVLYLAFATLTYSSLDSDSPVVAATFGTIAGPFTGAIARRFQSCCLQFSLKLLPFCAAGLGAAVILQAVPLPRWRYERALRLTGWSLGWLIWFAGAPASFVHALQ